MPAITVAQFITTQAQVLTITDNATLSVGDVALDICTWVNLTTLPALSTIRMICGKYDTLTDTEYRLYAQNAAGTTTFRFQVMDTGESGFTTATSSSSPTAGTWYFLHAYHDPTLNRIGISMNNGTHVTSSTSGGVLNGDSNFNIGAASVAPNLTSQLDGLVGPTGVWKHATSLLSADQLTALYNTGEFPMRYTELSTSLKTNLVAWWDLTEAEASTRVESVSGNNLQDVNNVSTDQFVWTGRMGSSRGVGLPSPRLASTPSSRLSR